MQINEMGNGSKFKIMSGINENKKNCEISTGKSKGQASIEFVLVIPFLILIILAVSHLGLLIYQKNVLEQAAREGVRVITTTNSNQEALKCIRRVCSGLDQDKLDIKITPENGASRRVGDVVEVIVGYRSGGIAHLLEVFTGRENLIKAKSNMRMECY